MTAKDIVREIMAELGWSQSKLAEACGMARQSNVTGVLNRGTSLRVDTLEQMIAPMGYEIVIRKASDGTHEMVVHEDGIVIVENAVSESAKKAKKA